MKKQIDYKRIAFIMIPVYIFIIALFLGYPLYGTNDDAYIAGIVSGRMSGTPSPSANTFNVFLGYIISSLYKIAFLPWFPLMLIITTILANMLVYDGFYTLFQNKHVGILIKSFSFIFYSAFLPRFIFFPSYTNVATFACMASIYCLYKNKKLLSVILLMLSFSIRYENGFVACVFWGLSYIYLHLKQKNTSNIKFIFEGIIVIALILGLHIGDGIVKAKIEPKVYNDFYRAQQIHFDYPKAKMSESEQNELLERAGIDVTTYNMILNYYYNMDNRLTTKAFDILNEKTLSLSKNKTANPLKLIYSKLMTDKSTFQIMLLIGILSAYIFFYSLKHSVIDSIFAMGIFIVSSLLLGFLLIKGRTPFRAILAFGYPAFMILLMQISTLQYEFSKKLPYVFNILALFVAIALVVMGRYSIAILFISLFGIFLFKDKISLSISSVLLIVLSLVFAFEGNLISNKELIAKKEDCDKRHIIESYAQEHRENVYIYSTDYSDALKMVNEKEGTYNLFPFGGTATHSFAHIQQMQKAGLESFDLAELTKPNVYFIDNHKDPFMRNDLTSILKAKNVNGSFKKIDTLDSKRYIEVYKFIED